MRATALALALITCGMTAAPAEDFTGTWVVAKVLEARKDGFPWSEEVKYPKSMTLSVRDGRLVGSYTDQHGFSDAFELVAVINGGHDVLLVHGGAGTKDPQSYSPVHHVKLTKGKLHAVVTSHEKLFEWIAERH